MWITIPGQVVNRGHLNFYTISNKPLKNISLCQLSYFTLSLS